MKAKELKFDAKHLMNHEHKPDSSWLSFMDKDEYKESMDVWDKAEKEVLYSNTWVEYDHCDCGGGYPCSHGSWPFAVHNNEQGQEISFEDEGIYIQGTLGSLSLKSLDFSMQEFQMYCTVVGYTLTLNTPS